MFGFWAGRHWPVPTPVAPVASATGVSIEDGKRNVAKTGEVADALTRALLADDWLEVDRWIAARQAQMGTAAVQARLGEIFEAARRAGTRLRQRQALRTLQNYVSLVPRDIEALFLISDLYQMNGRQRDALVPLFSILEYPEPTEVIERARQRLDLLVNARAQQFASVRDFTNLALFYEELSGRQPHRDDYRVAWVRALLAAGRLEAALQVLKETGTQGTTQAELDRLDDELQVRRSGIVVERRGNALMAEASVNGRTMQLLIDTGATMTGFTSTRLRRLGARYLGEKVRVLTAGGEVQALVYELDELVVGGRVFDNPRVLAIDSLPEGIDGILGMDVLTDVEGLLPQF